MTDNEITKALECCVLYKQICPETCPMVNIRQCKIELRKNALDLIKRQKAELSTEKAKKEICAEVIARLDAEIAELQRKNSELEIELQAMRGAANSYKAEMERLTDVLNATIAGQETLQRYMSTAKAEAYKEFAERLKEKATATHKSLDGKYVYEIDNDFIDSLVKEMEGEG